MMKIIKKGKTIPFICNSCDCQFVVGVHCIESEDGNYYSNCPMCGSRCHTDVSKIEVNEEKQKEKQ